MSRLCRSTNDVLMCFGSGDQGSGYASRAQIGANNLGNLYTSQADADGGASLSGALNTNQTLGGLARNIGEVDWSKLFKRGNASLPTIPTNTGGNPWGGAALPGTTR